MSAPGLAWQACFKKSGVELKLLANTDMLLMVGKGIRRVICHVIHTYAKQNNKYMANYNNCLESIFLMYLDGSNSYR